MTTLHRIDDLARPRLPWPIWTLNRSLAPFKGWVHLDESTLLRTTMKQTGLTDFGDGRFREPLRVLVAALEREARLWLATSIPQTYLMVASSSEDAVGVWFMIHLLSLDLIIPATSLRCIPMPGARARNPTDQGERELIADRQSDHDSCAIPCRWSLQQAS